MLSDVLIPILDLNDTTDPIKNYLTTLRLLKNVTNDVNILIPNHKSIGGADQIHAQIDQNRAYVHTLRDTNILSDPRVGPSTTYNKN